MYNGDGLYCTLGRLFAKLFIFYNCYVAIYLFIFYLKIVNYRNLESRIQITNLESGIWNLVLSSFSFQLQTVLEVFKIILNVVVIIII